MGLRRARSVTCGAGGYRLFTANDREATGIARFLPGFEIINPVVAQ